ncbi:MAG: Crp/Fnr family transcriptional regulator [Bacteroidota bacterium]
MTNQLSLAQIREYFPDFTEPELQKELVEKGRIHHFQEGNRMMDYGAYIRMIPLILEGRIKVSRLAAGDNELFLYYLTRGESCTMTFSCCMADKQSQIRAVAEEATTIFGLPHHVLDEWMMRYRSWKNFVLTAYDQRMNELVETIDQIAFQALDQRLIAYLQQRVKLGSSQTINSTHQQIAADLNVSRETISRLLKTLEKQGAIRLGRNKIELLYRL